MSVTAEQIDAYRTDGAVCLRGAVDGDWIDRLRRGVEQNIARPTERARTWQADRTSGTVHYDSQAWQQITEYRAFITESPLAALAGALMGSSRVNFFFDAIFVREAGSQFRTPFHQDEPYWSVEGFDCCSAWMPLVPVAKASALEFVRGSHLSDVRFRRENFGALTSDSRDDVVDADDVLPFPDVEGRREHFDILSWDMQPGDVAVFNARTIHGGSGNLAPDRDLPVFNTQWLGDDVRVRFRPDGMDPDHSAIMRSVGLADGDRVASELYPEIWHAA